MWCVAQTWNASIYVACENPQTIPMRQVSLYPELCAFFNVAHGVLRLHGAVVELSAKLKRRCSRQVDRGDVPLFYVYFYVYAYSQALPRALWKPSIAKFT